MVMEGPPPVLQTINLCSGQDYVKEGLLRDRDFFVVADI